MTARALNIDGRRRHAATSTASIDDFDYHEGRPVATDDLLESPDLSLYCLDLERQRAIFVRAPFDELRAAPFYYEAQYRYATELIAVPFEQFVDLANEVTLRPGRLVFIYSTGRCGSTLVSHAFGLAGHVISLSEPDVFTQLASLHCEYSQSAAQLRTLVLASLKLLHPHSTRDPRLRRCVLKFRGSVLAVSELLHELAPEAQVLFLYRDLTSWARSCARSLQSLEPSTSEHRPAIERIARQMLATTGPRRLPEHSLPPLDLLVCSWIAALQQCRHLRRHGVKLLSTTYAALQRAPTSTLTALLGYCDLHVTERDLRDLIELDAQADTALARAVLQSSPPQAVRLSDGQILDVLKHYAPDLAPDYVLPGTLQP